MNLYDIPIRYTDFISDETHLQTARDFEAGANKIEINRN